MATTLEIDAMRRAIMLSALGLGTTSPNPPVGCIILNADGLIVGTGFHQRKGEPHAEAHALAAAGAAAAGGTAVVTLEPCNHVGVTPACRQLLLDAGIRRVVVSVIDPTSRGAGGAAVLAEAGVDVETDVLTDETLTVLRPWLTATTTRRPYVTWTIPTGTDDKCDRLQPVIEQLRQRNDLVVFPDRVEEGIPNGHGKDRLHLPKTAVATDDPTTVLAEGYSGGARSLLLVGDTVLARTMLAQDLIDQLFLVTPRRGAAGDRDAALTDPLPATDLRITNVTTVDSAIIIEAHR